MEILTYRQTSRLLDSIEILNSGIESETLATRLIKSVSHLIPNDIGSIEAFRRTGEHLGVIVYDPIDAVPANHLETYFSLVHEHPLFQAVFGNNELGASPLTDLAATPGFERTALFNEYYRAVSVKQQIAIASPVVGDRFFTCALNRGSSRFDDSECELLQRFRPHLAAAIRNSWQFEEVKAREADVSAAIKQSGMAVITLDAKDTIAGMSGKAAELLERFFAEDGRAPNGLPASLAKAVSGSISSLSRDRADATLLCDISFDPGSGRTFVFMRSKPKMTPALFSSFGLTQTEADVIYWIALGRTNAEIADIRGSSPRTVQKHLENIFTKLGVENRTAAAILVRELLD